MVADRFVIVIQLYFFAFLCVSYAFDATGCPPEFEGRCKCGFVPYGPEKRLTYVTNCTNEGFDNTIMLRKLSTETEVLIFVGNEVKDLPLNIFGQEIDHERLHTIDLSNNHIQTIKGRTFHNVPNVTKLILNDNDLYIISKDHHPRMFSNFENLRELHLRNAFTEKVKAGDYLNNLAQIFENSTLLHLRVLNMENNEISSLYDGEFCSLPALEELHLGVNHLSDIHLNFSCLQNLKLLDVGSNLITHLKDHTIKSLEETRLVKLNLTANPFTCDCNLIESFKWMLTTPIDLINKENYFCYDGSHPIIGKSLFSLHIDELQCVASLSELEYHASASFIAMTIGFLCLVVVLTVLIYKNRVSVGTYLRRAFQPLRSKFHYVSLDRREATMEV